MEDSKFTTLVLSGGAVKGILILGALQSLYDRGIGKNIVNYVGTSIGSIICYLLAIGYTPIEIMIYICTHAIVEKMQSFNLISMVNGFGAVSYRPIQECLENMTLHKIERFITLKELKEKFNKNLYCTTYNLTLDKIEYISAETHPDMPCLIALKMSSNVPFLFEKFKYTGHYYTDGGVCNNFPIDKGFELGGENTIGLCLIKTPSPSPEGSDEISIVEYMFKVLYIPINQGIRYKIDLFNDKCTIIELTDSDRKFFDFFLSSRIKLNMFSQGYKNIADYFEGVKTENKEVV